MTVRVGPRVMLAAAGLLAVVGFLGVARGLSPASAASGGTVTGQVVWCAPLPYLLGVPGAAEGAAPAPAATPADPASTPGETKPAGMPAIAPDFRPSPVPRLIPAGAVLVAVQGTSLSARTAEDGRFVIEGVPAGQYLTVAAGPVAKINGAVASRPNVFLTEGQKTDLGQISLSQPCNSYGPVPYAVPATGAVTPDGGE